MHARKSALFAVCAIFVLLADQASKWAVLNFLPQNRTITIIDGVFDLVHVRNRGAAFGFLNRADIQWQFWFFLGATLLAVIAVFILARESRKPLLTAGLGLILGGALGNLADRLRFRSVVDFLDFYWQGWHWPAFNIADMGICVGAFITCIAMWKKGEAG